MNSTTHIKGSSRKAREELATVAGLQALIRTLQRERDEARYHLKIYAHAYANDNRPPPESIAYATTLCRAE